MIRYRTGSEGIGAERLPRRVLIGAARKLAGTARGILFDCCCDPGRVIGASEALGDRRHVRAAPCILAMLQAVLWLPQRTAAPNRLGHGKLGIANNTSESVISYLITHNAPPKSLSTFGQAC